jgi:hypothetical protein
VSVFKHESGNVFMLFGYDFVEEMR